VSASYGESKHVLDYIAPIGRLFLNLLKMIAVPLVLFSLVAGVASLNGTSKLGRIGGKSIFLYLITIGLVAVNLFGPGKGLSQATRDSLTRSTAADTTARLESADVSIIDQLVNIVPTNPFGALAEAQMLQVVFFALMLGIALTKLSRRVEGTAPKCERGSSPGSTTTRQVSRSLS
jgi:Na+/H+-dicarboxylate symporter